MTANYQWRIAFHQFGAMRTSFPMVFSSFKVGMQRKFLFPFSPFLPQARCPKIPRDGKYWRLANFVFLPFSFAKALIDCLKEGDKLGQSGKERFEVNGFVFLSQVFGSGQSYGYAGMPCSDEGEQSPKRIDDRGDSGFVHDRPVVLTSG